MTPTPAAPSGELPTMRAAFRTTESCGPENRYLMVFKFPSLAALDKADDEWRAAVSQAAPEQATPTPWNVRMGVKVGDMVSPLSAFPHMKAEILEWRALAAPSGAPKQENAWRDLFWEIAKVLNCLPSSFVDANGHVIAAAEKLCNLAAASTVQAQQAKIDALMLEHSPDEMTPDQVAEWGKRQQSASTVQSAPVLPDEAEFARFVAWSERFTQESGGQVMSPRDAWIAAKREAAQSTPVQVEGQQEQTDDEFDRNAARLTNEMGLGGGTLNPNATSVTDLFMEDLPSCDSALHAEPASQHKIPEPGYSDSLADRVFNLPCNWKGDQRLFDAILMGHCMACEQAYDLVWTHEQTRSAGSARQGGEHAPEIVQAVALPVAAAPEHVWMPEKLTPKMRDVLEFGKSQRPESTYLNLFCTVRDEQRQAAAPEQKP